LCFINTYCLTPSYAASYSQQNKKDQGSFRYRALNFIADMKRQLINEDDIAKQTEDENVGKGQSQHFFITARQ
jgi:hypothetical protein